MSTWTDLDDFDALLMQKRVEAGLPASEAAPSEWVEQAVGWARAQAAGSRQRRLFFSVAEERQFAAEADYAEAAEWAADRDALSELDAAASDPRFDDFLGGAA